MIFGIQQNKLNRDNVIFTKAELKALSKDELISLAKSTSEDAEWDNQDAEVCFELKLAHIQGAKFGGF